MKEIKHRPGFLLGFIDFFTAGLFFMVYMPLGLQDETMWKFWIFTQVLITTVPGLVMENRKSRKGFNLGLHIVLICVALVSFNPWCNMWVCIKPEFFSLEANPWYYIMGVLCLFFAIRGTVQYLKLPAKE